MSNVQNTLLEKVSKTEEAIEEGKRWRTSALANEQMYKENIANLEKELGSYGINSATAQEDLAKMEAEMNRELAEIQNLIPYELMGLTRP